MLYTKISNINVGTKIRPIKDARILYWMLEF